MKKNGDPNFDVNMEVSFNKAKIFELVVYILHILGEKYGKRQHCTETMAYRTLKILVDRNQKE